MVQDSKSRRTFWNDSLPLEARDIVETCLERILTQGWGQRRATIETTIAGTVAQTAPLRTGCDSAGHLTGPIVAAIIERLETPEIVEFDQAELFAMSACPDHQIAACDWLIEAASATSHMAELPYAPAGMRLH